MLPFITSDTAVPDIRDILAKQLRKNSLPRYVRLYIVIDITHLTGLLMNFLNILGAGLSISDILNVTSCFCATL